MNPFPHISQDLGARLGRSGLKPLQLGGRELLPIVQGGMGTLSSVDLRHHHPDLVQATRDCRSGLPPATA